MNFGRVAFIFFFPSGNYQFLILLCAITLLLICGDVELNIGPKKINSCYNFSVCH